jgi:hypothetical protein
MFMSTGPPPWLHSEPVRDGCDLDPLGWAAGAAIVRLHHVDAFL